MVLTMMIFAASDLPMLRTRLHICRLWRQRDFSEIKSVVYDVTMRRCHAREIRWRHARWRRYAADAYAPRIAAAYAYHTRRCRRIERAYVVDYCSAGMMRPRRAEFAV